MHAFVQNLVKCSNVQKQSYLEKKEGETIQYYGEYCIIMICSS
jgi:hypothetical protein